VAHDPLTAEARTALERIGAAELVIAVPISQSRASLDGVAAAVRTGLETRFAGHSAAVIQIARAPDDEPEAAQPVQPFGTIPHVRIQPAHAPGGLMAEGWRDEAVSVTLAAGRALDARAILLLDPEIKSLTVEWVGGLGGALLADDCGMVVPVYQSGRYEGTLTQALVVPLVRALFGKRLARPLAEEFGCSGKAAQFLLEQDVWATDLGRDGIEFWMPAAVIAEGLPISETALGPRRFAAPARPTPLGEIVGRTARALFAIAERHEIAWLEREGSDAVPCAGPLPELRPDPAPDPERMLGGFRQGVRDLLPVWERILAPETLNDVLALSEEYGSHFRFPDRLWAHVVYDFLLAYRARVVYRSHVAQSLAPLYLGRVASVICETRERPPSAVAEVTERLCRVFEQSKPYLTDRWR